jgi:hypothetical protein
MSATPNINLYEKLFGKDNVKIHDCRTIKYKGNLIQYYNRSMSRGYVRNNPDIYNIIRETVKEFEGQKNLNMSKHKIAKKVEKMAILTFKGKIPDARHWFGNLSGTNDYEKQDIIVAGTPHFPDHVYKLLALTLGFEFDIDAKPQYQEVEHNGYKFWFTTYNDEILRDIQFWLIESELLQAVGRARLIWHNCTVYLFSDFPLKQAQLYQF